VEIQNNKEEVPFSYYADQFAKADPAEISARLNLPFENNAFRVTLLGKEYLVHHPSANIVGGGALDAPQPALPVQTFLLRYLLESKSVCWGGEWKTFREMPWGEMYIKPYTGRVLTRAAYTFSFKLNAFRAAAQKMGAQEVKHGDAGCQFHLIGDYHMQILVWQGDEEFPPNAQILYSDNFAEGFAAEDRVVAGDILISTIKANM
jgi:hypothetical protein